MSKLIAFYKVPAEPAALEQAYINSHLPLIAKVPGVQKTLTTRFTRTRQGDGYNIMAEMRFEDRESLKLGVRSPEIAAGGGNINSFAAGLVTLVFGEEEGA